jgi:L-ribulose-5-phosphate 4-epimerase
MKAEDMVVVDMDGNVVEGKRKPSSDTPTHLELYKAFPQIGGITHTHSTFATAWAQAGRDIPFYGTTHADYFYGDIPCTRPLTEKEMRENYELSTGHVIIETFKGKNPMEIPAVIVANHGAFTWGKDTTSAVENSTVLEQVAHMAKQTEAINPSVTRVPESLLSTHFLRKHGKKSYYGQE